VLWNAEAQRRLLPVGTSREDVDGTARHYVVLTGGMLGVGALAAALASAMTRAEARIKPPRKPKRRRAPEVRR
jgi:hypothetical protein